MVVQNDNTDNQATRTGVISPIEMQNGSNSMNDATSMFVRNGPNNHNNAVSRLAKDIFTTNKNIAEASQTNSS